MLFNKLIAIRCTDDTPKEIKDRKFVWRGRDEIKKKKNTKSNRQNVEGKSLSSSWTGYTRPTSVRSIRTMKFERFL